MLVGECVGKSDSPNRKIWITLPRSQETTTYMHTQTKQKKCWPASLVDQQVTCLNRMSFHLGCQEDSYLTDRLHGSSFGKMPLFNVLEIISPRFNKIKSSFQNVGNEQKMHFGSNKTRVLLKETRGIHESALTLPGPLVPEQMPCACVHDLQVKTSLDAFNCLKCPAVLQSQGRLTKDSLLKDSPHLNGLIFAGSLCMKLPYAFSPFWCADHDLLCFSITNFS